MTTEQELLNKAAEEIIRLRKRNEVMSIKLDMFDRVTALVYSQPPNHGGMEHSPYDIVKDIDGHLRDNLDELSKAVREAVIKR